MENLIGLFVFLGIVWIIVAIIVGNYGKDRTIGFEGAFFASLLLSPILAMLFVLASDKVKAKKVISKPYPIIVRTPAEIAQYKRESRNIMWCLVIFIIIFTIMGMVFKGFIFK